MGSPIDALMDGIEWKDTGATFDDGELPYATHEGIWHFMGKDIRVYRLNTGQAIIHADDMGKIFGLE